MAIEFGSPGAAAIRAADRRRLLEQAQQVLDFVPKPVKRRLNYYRFPYNVAGQVADWLERLPAGQQSAGYSDLAQMFAEGHTHGDSQLHDKS